MPKLNTQEKQARKKLSPARATRSRGVRYEPPIPYRVVSDEENERMVRACQKLGAELLAVAARLALRGVR